MRIALTIVILITGKIFFSQDTIPNRSSLSVYFQQNFATFEYKNSLGEKDPNLTFASFSGLGINYSNQINKKLFARAGIGFRPVGATSSLDNQKISWSLKYLSSYIGAGYSFTTSNLKPYCGAIFYGSYLLKASQEVAQNSYNLLDNNSIKKLDFGIQPFGGLSYELIDELSLFMEIHYIIGLFQLETNLLPEQNQKLYNRSTSFLFGLSIPLK